MGVALAGSTTWVFVGGTEVLVGGATVLVDVGGTAVLVGAETTGVLVADGPVPVDTDREASST